MISLALMVLGTFILLISIPALVSDTTRKVIKDFCNIECK